MQTDETNNSEIAGESPGVIGRGLRLLVGLSLVVFSAFLLLGLPLSFLARTVFLIGLILGFYSGVHYVVNSRLPTLNRWLGAVLANGILVVVFLLGGAGGLILGRGEGRVAAMGFAGISLVIAAIRSDPGCEVMSFPGLIFGQQTYLVCLLFSPIDWVEHTIRRWG